MSRLHKGHCAVLLQDCSMKNAAITNTIQTASPEPGRPCPRRLETAAVRMLSVEMIQFLLITTPHCACVLWSVLVPMLSSADLSWLSESIRKLPEATTFSPALNPLAIT